MTFDELDATIRERISQMPRGFQAELAGKLSVSRQYVSHVVSGRSPISRDHYQVMLDALGIEITLQKKVDTPQ